MRPLPAGRSQSTIRGMDAAHGPRPAPGTARLRLQFTYPADKIQSPIVYELVRRFDLRLNIRRADIDAGIGWIQMLLEGEHDELDAAVAWAEEQGIRVDPVEGEIVSG